MSAALALINSKYPHNVAAVYRAASCYGIQAVAFSGDRVVKEIEKQGRIPREERLGGYQHVGLYHNPDPIAYLAEQIPGAVPVAVELRPNAESLFEFDHPENAVYVMGPEDGSLDRSVLSRCHRFVVIPTLHCTNLSAAVYTLLYDRAIKRYRDTGERPVDLEINNVPEEENLAMFVRTMRQRLSKVN